MAVLNSHLQRSVNCKYRNIERFHLKEDKNSKPKSFQFPLTKELERELKSVVSAAPKAITL